MEKPGSLEWQCCRMVKSTTTNTISRYMNCLSIGIQEILIGKNIQKAASSLTYTQWSWLNEDQALSDTLHVISLLNVTGSSPMARTCYCIPLMGIKATCINNRRKSIQCYDNLFALRQDPRASVSQPVPYPTYLRNQWTGDWTREACQWEIFCTAMAHLHGGHMPNIATSIAQRWRSCLSMIFSICLKSRTYLLFPWSLFWYSYPTRTIDLKHFLFALRLGDSMRLWNYVT